MCVRVCVKFANHHASGPIFLPGEIFVEDWFLCRIQVLIIHWTVALSVTIFLCPSVSLRLGGNAVCPDFPVEYFDNTVDEQKHFVTKNTLFLLFLLNFFKLYIHICACFTHI